jgi:hypothetical protein
MRRDQRMSVGYKANILVINFLPIGESNSIQLGDIGYGNIVYFAYVRH